MTLVEVGRVGEVIRRKKTVVEHDGQEILVLAVGESLHAFQNRCIHKQRQLHKGVVLNGRLICPGHQWAFDLATGYEAAMEECQPTYTTVVRGDVVYVDTDSRCVQVPGAGDAAGTTSDPEPVADTSA